MKIWQSFSLIAFGIVMSLGVALAQQMIDDEYIPGVEEFSPMMADAIAVGDFEPIEARQPMRERMMTREDYDMPMYKSNMVREEREPMMESGQRMMRYDDFDGGRRYKKYSKNNWDKSSNGGIIIYKIICVIGMFIFLFIAAGVVRKGWEWGGHSCLHRGGFFNKEK